MKKDIYVLSVVQSFDSSVMKLYNYVFGTFEEAEEFLDKEELKWIEMFKELKTTSYRYTEEAFAEWLENALYFGPSYGFEGFDKYKHYVYDDDEEMLFTIRHFKMDI